MNDRENVIARLMALLELSGVGPAGVNRLRSLAGSTNALICALEGDAREPRLAVDPLFQRIAGAWSGVDTERQASRIRETYESGCQIVLADDPQYPANLRGITTAPPLLYVRGSLAGLRPRALALVGSVDPTERGRARAKKMARLCTDNGIQVISGLARGIDGASHEAALEGGVPTFAVVGHGLRYLFPPEHQELAGRIAQAGAIISQFPPDIRPSRWTFPMRNEVMCTIAKGTVIVEVERDEKFGSVIQARFSIKHGRPVFVLSSNIHELHSPVAAELVNSGDAVEVRDFQDVLATLEKASQIFASGQDSDLFTGMPMTTEGLEAEVTDAKTPCAILFDLDGVIHDPRAVMKRAYAEAVRTVSKKDVQEDEFDSILGLPPSKVFAHFGVAFQDANRIYNTTFNRLTESLLHVYEPVVAFVHRAQSSGFKIGVVTNQPRGRLDKVLQLVGLGECLDVSIAWNDVPKGKHKPDPYPLCQALEYLHVSPDRAVYVGDSPNDLLAARRARMKSVAVGWGMTSEDALMRFSPDLFVSEFRELDAVMELCSGDDQLGHEAGPSVSA